jgi:uncharacterized RDD family membrane protein YckC
VDERTNVVHENSERISEQKAPTYPYAGFWMRFWAYLADLLIIASINWIVISPIFKAIHGPFYETTWYSPETLLTGAVFYLYFIFMTKFFGQTLGKMIFGLKVISLKEEKISWSTLLFREAIGRYISKFTVVGYLITGFLPKKQGLHDLFADTTVVLEKRR